MKLKKYLESIEDGLDICVGSKTGYVYFGKKGDGSVIVDRFYEHKRKTRKYLEKTNEELLNLMTAEYDKNLTSDELMKEVREKAIAVSQMLYRINQYEKFIKGYENPMNREVINVYQKEVDNCFAIIISGDEAGDFWLKSEYDAKYCS